MVSGGFEGGFRRFQECFRGADKRIDVSRRVKTFNGISRAEGLKAFLGGLKVESGHVRGSKTGFQGFLALSAGCKYVSTGFQCVTRRFKVP